VMFSSDNGPWLFYGDHGGSAVPLREGKGTTFDGGQREPCIMRWPGKIPAGSVCREVATTMDVLPTLAKLTGADLPTRRIDGKDIWPLMSGEAGAKSPHEAFFFVRGNELQAVRSGRWKLHLPHSYRSVSKMGSGGVRGIYVNKRVSLSLFDLETDVGETRNVAAEHPEVVERLQAIAKVFDDELKKNIREPGRFVEP